MPISESLAQVRVDLKGDGVAAGRLVQALEAEVSSIDGPGLVRILEVQPTVDLYRNGSGPLYTQPTWLLTVIPPVRLEHVDTLDDQGRFLGFSVAEGTGVQADLAAAAVEAICGRADWAALILERVEVSPSRVEWIVAQALEDDPFRETWVVSRTGSVMAGLRVSRATIHLCVAVGDHPEESAGWLVDWVQNLDPQPWTATLVPSGTIGGAPPGMNSAGGGWAIPGPEPEKRDRLVEAGWFNFVPPTLDNDPAFVDAVRSLGSDARLQGRTLWLGELAEWIPLPNTEPHDELRSLSLRPSPASTRPGDLQQALWPFISS